MTIVVENSPSASDHVLLIPPAVYNDMESPAPPPLVAARRSATLTPTSEIGGFTASAYDWTDIYEDESGKDAGVVGYRRDDLNVKQLRLLCGQLCIKGIQNIKKVTLLTASRRPGSSARHTFYRQS